MLEDSTLAGEGNPYHCGSKERERKKNPGAHDGIRNNERAAKFVVSKDWIMWGNDQGDKESKKVWRNK